MPRTLTGKEAKFAAENKIPVHYQEIYDNPSDRHMNFNGECVMEPCAGAGYYIGNSDIDLTDFADGEPVVGEFPEGNFKIMTAKHQNYQTHG